MHLVSLCFLGIQNATSSKRRPRAWEGNLQEKTESRRGPANMGTHVSDPST